jgi:hypothetical protein
MDTVNICNHESSLHVLLISMRGKTVAGPQAPADFPKSATRPISRNLTVPSGRKKVSGTFFAQRYLGSSTRWQKRFLTPFSSELMRGKLVRLLGRTNSLFGKGNL